MQFNSLKVCVIGPVPPPAGGMANQTAELCRLLDSEGANVTLVATNAPYHPLWIAKIKGLRAVFRLIPYLYRLRKSIADADVVHVMANSGWSWHLFATPAIWIADWLDTPVVLNYRGGHAERFFARSWRWVAPTLKRASACIVPSKFLEEIFHKRQIQTHIIPNTLDTALFYPPTESRWSQPGRASSDTTAPLPGVREAQTGTRTTGPVLIITRNLEKIYGIDVAIQAFPLIRDRFPGATLIVAGSGHELEALTVLAKQEGVDKSVDFCGRLDRQQMAQLYRQADVMINPSRVDNSPNSIIESLGSGLPVVSTRAGGIPLLVEDGKTAILVDIDQPVELSTAVLTLLNDLDLYQQLRSSGLEFSQRFHWQQIRTELLQIYTQAINNNA